MNSKYKKYRLKKGDTLSGVASILGKPVQEIKNFHNIFCEHEEVIVFDFPETLQELFIYPQYEDAELYNIPRTPLDGSRLSLKPSEKSIDYGVMYTIHSGEEENTMKYEVRVSFLEKLEASAYLYRIERLSKTFINDDEANTIADELAEKAASVLYPLEVVVDENGKWQQVYNHHVILSRWEKVKDVILDEFEGEWVDKYLMFTERTLENEIGLNSSLSKDWFLNAYFSGVYANYTNQLKYESETLFNLLPSTTALSYKTEHKIEQYLDEDNLIAIEINGFLNDERCKADIEENNIMPYYSLLDPAEKKAEGKFRSKYFLNGSNKTIETLYVDCSIDLAVPKRVEIVVSVL